MCVVWSIANALYGLIVWLQNLLGTGASMIGVAQGGRTDLINRRATAELAMRGATCESGNRIDLWGCVRLDLGAVLRWPTLGSLGPGDLSLA
jgi:hypothetical protein